ncbi:glycosyltransferase family 2 protein [Cognatiluteimonas profundi]|uniref:glycosyltransferase family 2 protein n=1 Tax=Cognatiluteimonas profundi TaxID=2594501 RepID=UPI00131BF10B|nr:glycosyltransferase family 2 protein [Lysobacter profundi]
MLSIVGTMFHAQSYLEEFVARAIAAASATGLEFEIVLVNDGSPDLSLAMAKSLADLHPQVRVVDLSRNFGHHRAMMIGLQHSSGALVFLIDLDLEEPPELLADFLSTLAVNPDADVVYGRMKARKGGVWERFSGWAFYSLLHGLGGIAVPRNISTVRLMTRRYVDSLGKYGEREVFMAGLWQDTGYKQVPFEFIKGYKGETTYHFARKLSLLVNSIVAFSSKPLAMIFTIGTILSLGAGAYTLYLIYVGLVRGTAPSGWASLIASIWLLGGLIIFFLGVIGIYLSKIFIEVKQRPYATVREIYEGRGNDR